MLVPHLQSLFLAVTSLLRLRYGCAVALFVGDAAEVDEYDQVHNRAFHNFFCDFFVVHRKCITSIYALDVLSNLQRRNRKKPYLFIDLLIYWFINTFIYLLSSHVYLYCLPTIPSWGNKDNIPRFCRPDQDPLNLPGHSHYVKVLEWGVKSPSKSKSKLKDYNYISYYII